MTALGQNEMKPSDGMPWRVRLIGVLGVTLSHQRQMDKT